MNGTADQFVRVVEVGPRDGLQNEAQPVPTGTKARFIEQLVAAGLREIEVTSFVHPNAVPQLADATELLSRIAAPPGVMFSALVPNQKGLDRAIEAGVRRIAVFTAASDAFTAQNIRMTVRESLDTFAPLVASALSHGMTVRGYVSTSFVCPYAGEVPPARVVEVTRALADMGVEEVAISDTIGAATPNNVRDVIEQLKPVIPADRLALHFHDTFGTALANVVAGLEMGIRTFDASAGGLGGCPYAPGASGNLATEDLLHLLHRMGYSTGVSLEGVAAAATLIAECLQRELPGRNWRRVAAAGIRTCAPPSADA